MKKNNNYSFLIILVITIGLVGGLIYLVSKTKEDWRLQYATKLGLDIVKFEADMASDTVVSKVEADISEGEDRGLSSTPSIFVNGEQLSFQSDFALELKTAVDNALLVTDAVLIEEFSDLQCPACNSFHESTIDLRKEYASNDNITWVFKNFPLSSIHPFAYDAAIAAEAARQQGKFSEMQDLLFANQESFKQPNFK